MSWLARSRIAPAVLAAGLLLLAAPPPALGQELGIQVPPVSQIDSSQLTDLPLNLDEAVRLALENNRGLVEARTFRTIQKWDLEEAERYFRPKLSLGVGADYRNSPGSGDRGRSSSAGGGLFPSVSVSLPTGGSLGISTSWSGSAFRGDWSEGAGLSINLSQPLLKGGGFTVGRAPLINARIAEERNLLSFKATIMDTVTSVIKAYRALAAQELHLEIALQALDRAKDQMEVNRLLADAGKLAVQDLKLTEADVATRELSVEQQQISLDDAARNFQLLLGIEANIRIKPIEPMTFKAVHPDIGQSQITAQKNHAPYLNAILALREAELQALIAKNNALWDVSLNASASFSGGGDSPGKSFDSLASNFNMGQYAVGVSVSVPLGNREANQRKRQEINTRMSLARARYGLTQTTREMQLSVRDAVRAVEFGNRGVLLAQQAKELSEQKLNIEREKLRLGLSSTFQIATFEADLVGAQTAELDSIIAHLNALADLDRLLGTVLDTWGIEVE